MEKNVILAVLLTVLLLFGYNYFILNQQKDGKRTVEKKEASGHVPEAREKEENTALEDSQNNATLSMEEKGKIEPAKKKETASLKQENVIMENGLIKLILSNKGGVADQVFLKNYEDYDYKGMMQVTTSREMDVAPMASYLYINGKRVDANDIIFTVREKKGTGSTAVAFSSDFSYGETGNITVEKIFSLKKNSYIVNTSLKLTNNSADPVSVNGSNRSIVMSWGNSFENYFKKGFDQHNQNITTHSYYLVNGKLKNVGYKGAGMMGGMMGCGCYGSGANTQAEDEEIKASGNPKWISVADKYFAVIMIPSPDDIVNASFLKTKRGNMGMFIEYPGVTVPAGSSVEKKMDVFIGPKHYEVLGVYGRKLDELAGMNFLSKFFLGVLKFIYRFVANYGIAIIILTVLLKIVLYPLAQKSMVSMKQMQSVQPLMKEMKEKYKNDKEKQNSELMKLYKEKGINPLSGCLPLLIQLPILWALFIAFGNAVELRHASFLWIKDMSSYDPYFVLPIVMGATMLIQQKMTPSADPQQARMMMIMPVIFTVMFIYFSAGLVLYWLIQNILSIAHQYIFNKSVKIAGN